MNKKFNLIVFCCLLFLILKLSVVARKENLHNSEKVINLCTIRCVCILWMCYTKDIPRIVKNVSLEVILLNVKFLYFYFI